MTPDAIARLVMALYGRAARPSDYDDVTDGPLLHDAATVLEAIRESTKTAPRSSRAATRHKSRGANKSDFRG